VWVKEFVLGRSVFLWVKVFCVGTFGTCMSKEICVLGRAVVVWIKEFVLGSSVVVCLKNLC